MVGGEDSESTEALVARKQKKGHAEERRRKLQGENI